MKRFFLKSFLLLSIFFFTGNSWASDLRIRGQVKGLTSTDRKTVPVVLSRVSVSVSLEGNVVVTKTNLAGVYIIELKRDKRYLMTVSRNGYNAKSVWISTHNLPRLVNKSHVELTDFDFLLLKSDVFPDDISLKEDIGQIEYNTKKKSFDLNVNKDFRHQKVNHDNSIRLANKTITYLGELEMEEAMAAKEVKQKSTKKASKSVVQEEISDTPIEESSIEEEIIDVVVESDTVDYKTLEGIAKRRESLNKAKEQLAKLWEDAKTREDSLRVMRLEAEIKAAESSLKHAEEVISSQQKKLDLQSRLNTFYVISILLLLAIAGVIFYFYRDKLRINRELAEKNQLILDGITYANTIQSSFLKSEEDIQKVLPEFVLLFRPRDIVSGDIYWVSKVNSKSIIAAIDCTGHGVPGAFISMIANTLLNEIVNNKKVLDPGKILEDLHLGVMETLQQREDENGSQDGMDMSLLVIDNSLKKMQFAGAKNHMYKVNGDDLEIVRADLNSIGGRSMRPKDGFNKTFKTTEVNYDANSTYYLFSDGFMDQFGGPDERKFNLPNFQNLLKECAKLSLEKQKKKLEESFDAWKGDVEQLDDVLVFGLKVKS